MQNSRDKIRVLVVDDHKAFFEALSEQADMCFYEHPIECRFVTCGAEAMTEITAWEPTVVLLDAHIPDINGFEIVKRCKDGATKVIVTSDTRSDDIAETAREKGACGYMSKTVDPDDIDLLLNQIAHMSEENLDLH